MTAIPTNAKKELFQYGYLNCLTAQVGIDILDPKVDYDKVDCVLKHPGLVFETDVTGGAMVQVQLKATSSPQYIESGKMLSFPIEKKFCELVHKEQANWRFLFILHCAAEVDNWTAFYDADRHLRLYHVMYWAGLRNIPDPGNDIEGSVNIRIPTTQIVTISMLRKMLSAQANRDLSILYEQEEQS